MPREELYIYREEMTIEVEGSSGGAMSMSTSLFRQLEHDSEHDDRFCRHTKLIHCKGLNKYGQSREPIK